MAAFPGTAIAGAAGTAQVRIQHARSGIVWVVSQIGVTSSTLRSGSTATVSLNGQYITSAQFLPQSAQGQPFITLTGADVLTIDFAGLTSGDTAIANLLYEEGLWGQQRYLGTVV